MKWVLLAAVIVFSTCRGHSSSAAAAEKPTPEQTWASLNLPSAGVPHSSRALSGHVVVVMFMATYCFPCLAQVPLLAQLHEQHATKGLKVVAVGMDLEGALVLTPFAERYALKYPLLIASNALRDGQSAFGRIPALPATIVLGPDGRERATFAGLPEREELFRVVERALRNR